MSEEAAPVSRALAMHPKDNVATALSDVAPGHGVEIEGGEETWTIRAAEAVPFGHKIALKKIPANAKVRKYGEVIGSATRNIPKGTHVHVHNIKSARG